MIITNLSIRKVSKDDPRYPKDTDLTCDSYLFACEVEGDKLPIECAFFVRPELGDLTKDLAANMLRLFSRALDHYQETEKAA